MQYMELNNSVYYLLEETFETEDGLLIGITLKREYPEKAHEIFDQRGTKYNKDDIDWELELEPGMEIDDMTYSYIEYHALTELTEDEIFARLTAPEIISFIISDDRYYSLRNIRLNMDPDEAMNLVPTVEYAAEVMEREFDPGRAAELLTQYDTLYEAIKTAAYDAGWPDDTKVGEIFYDIDCIGVTASWDEIAEVMLDDIIAFGGLSQWVQTMYDDLYNNGFLEVKINVMPYGETEE